MSRTAKFLIGLAAALLMGWLYHGPFGHGGHYIHLLEEQAQAAVADAEVPGVTVQLGRDPLSRAATLSGPADDFQREGRGSLKGLNDRVREIEGVSNVGWADQGGAAGGLPLLAELLIGVLIAYLLGVALGWFLYGRPKRESYL